MQSPLPKPWTNFPSKYRWIDPKPLIPVSGALLYSTLLLCLGSFVVLLLAGMVVEHLLPVLLMIFFSARRLFAWAGALPRLSAMRPAIQSSTSDSIQPIARPPNDTGCGNSVSVILRPPMLEAD